MKHYNQSIFLGLFFLFIIGSACTSNKTVVKLIEPSLTAQYKEALRYAAFPGGNKVDNNLTVIAKINPNLVWKTIKGEEYVLVSSWKEDTIHYKNDSLSGFYNTQRWPIWVTTVPELTEKCKTLNITDQNRDQRLKQLLGMPLSTSKHFFVQFWVRPQDLFRPCPDAEITDKQCELCFPKNVSEAHKKWINNQRIASYYNCELDQNYPWSQLGYTYDWYQGNPTHVGLSEFVIGANKNVVVEGFYPTRDYCK